MDKEGPKRRRELAKRLGVGVGTVNRWCQGTRAIPSTVAAYLRDVEPESEGQGMTGEELHAELKRRGWQQRELVRRLGVREATVSRWRRGYLPVPSTVVAYLRDVELESEGQSMTGDELRAELKRRGWRQAELARRLGVSPVTVNRWAQGKQAIHPAVAAYLRDVPREVADKGEQIAWSPWYLRPATR